MNPAQRNRTLALVRAGFEDGPALTVASTDGEIPQGRELSFAWLTGTVMTGLTSVMLMGAALYVSFQGQDTFSTAYEALQIVTSDSETATDLINKTNRVRPVTVAKSELEIVEASIRETVDGRDLIKKQPFVRIRATLATAATALSEDIPAYDPQAMIDSTQPIVAPDDANTSIYGAEVEGEVSIRTSTLPASLVPARVISDQDAEAYVRMTLENFFGEGGSGSPDPALAYAPEPSGVQDLGVVEGGVTGFAENVTVLPKRTTAAEAGLGRTERILTVKEPTKIEDLLLKNGFTDKMIEAISGTLTNVYPSTTLPSRARLRILFGVLEVVLGQNRVAGGLGVARQLEIFLRHMRRIAAHLHVRTVRFEVPAQRIDVLAPAIVVPAALAVLVALVGSHWSIYAFKMSLWVALILRPAMSPAPKTGGPQGRGLFRELFQLNHFGLITSGRVPHPEYPRWLIQRRR